MLCGVYAQSGYYITDSELGGKVKDIQNCVWQLISLDISNNMTSIVSDEVFS
jgi:hypothetical protein